MPRKFERWASRRQRQDARNASGANEKAKIVKQIQAEAKEAGATLANAGRGGLDPNLALEVFQRDEWTCSVPNCNTPKEDLDLDHIGGHAHELEEDEEAAAWLQAEAKKGKQNNPDGLHVLCLRHHNMVHQRERAIEDGKQPPPMSE
jgi:hypothetical protein